MVKSPISFTQFAKDPVKGLLFMVILAVGYLYIDNKTNYTSQIEKCEKNESAYCLMNLALCTVLLVVI